VKLLLTEIADKWVRENFKRLQDFLRDEPLLRGNFQFVEFAVSSSGTHSVPHRLGFQPSEVIQLYISPDSVTTTWKFDSFTQTTFSVYTSAACTIRAYIGRHEEGE
jgi:hypothetical protein